MQLLNRDDLRRQPGVNWLVEDWIQDRAIGLIYGEPESYKSFLVLDLICSIATGVPFLGQPTQQGAVVYVATEGHDGVPDRITAWEEAHGVTVPADQARFVLEAVALDEAGEVDHLQEVIEVEMRGIPLRLLVVDTVSGALQNGDENSNADVARLIRCVEGLARHLGAAAILVHHNTGDEPRGAKALRGNTSYRFLMRKSGGRRVDLVCKKMKDARHPRTMSLELREAGPSCVLDLVEDRPPRVALAPARERAVPYLEQFLQVARLEAPWTRRDLLAVTGLPEGSVGRVLRAWKDADMLPPEGRSYWLTARGLAVAAAHALPG